MALFKRGEVWWYEFIFAGRQYPGIGEDQPETIALEAERGRRLELEKTLAGLPVEKWENRHQFRGGRREEVSRPL